MDAVATGSDCNANTDDLTTSVNNNVDADRGLRSRGGRFGFKPPPTRQGRAGAGSRSAMLRAAADSDPPSVNGHAGDAGDCLAPVRGPPATKKPARQTTGRNRASALRRPAQRAGSSSRSANAQAPSQQQRVGKATSSDAPRMVNGSSSGASSSSIAQKPSADKSVKLLVNYRSTNDRHAPLKSAYGNRDCFRQSSPEAAALGAVDATACCAPAVPNSDDSTHAEHSIQSR